MVGIFCRRQYYLYWRLVDEIGIHMIRKFLMISRLRFRFVVLYSYLFKKTTQEMSLCIHKDQQCIKGAPKDAAAAEAARGC